MKRTLLVVLAVILVSCNQQRGSPPQTKDSEEPLSVSVTHWTDQTELFLEYAPLVDGQKSRFAVHLTTLDDFKPVADGAVAVELWRGEQQTARFIADGPGRPGIFGIDVTAPRAGNYNLLIRLRRKTVEDMHDLGSIVVHSTISDAAAAPRQIPPQEETIEFLKEQQWTLDFATEVVQERELRESLRVPARIEPRTGGVAEVTVPFAARLVSSGGAPALGEAVRKGQVLGGLLPPTSSPADLPALELSRAEAEAALELARKDRTRMERLVNAGAVPLRRLEEAQAVEATASARVRAAQARIEQYEATRAAIEDPSGARIFLLRAPVSGIIAETHATSGANVEAGENLFKIVDTENVYVIGEVSEVEAAGLRKITGAELEVPGIPKLQPLRRLISVGRLIDPQSRTLKVIYQVENRDRGLAVGQSVFLRIFFSPSLRAPAVPESAIIDDAGRPVVFVQLGGEGFARRPVRLGRREGGHVQASGVRTGERVVSRGAHLIRLAALSTQLPAHGHVH